MSDDATYHAKYYQDARNLMLRLEDAVEESLQRSVALVAMTPTALVDESVRTAEVYKRLTLAAQAVDGLRSFLYKRQLGAHPDARNVDTETKPPPTRLPGSAQKYTP